jgi:hypothetical protein
MLGGSSGCLLIPTYRAETNTSMFRPIFHPLFT